MSWYDHRGHRSIGQGTNEISIKALPYFPTYPVNHSVRVYRDGSRVVNGVALKDLDDHIQYNKTFRWGTALFINGICVNYGYLDKKTCDKIMLEIFEEKPVVKETVGLYQ